MSYQREWQSESYKRLINLVGCEKAMKMAEIITIIQPDGWIVFRDGSKYNTANNCTINPDDTIIK